MACTGPAIGWIAAHHHQFHSSPQVIRQSSHSYFYAAAPLPPSDWAIGRPMLRSKSQGLPGKVRLARDMPYATNALGSWSISVNPGPPLITLNSFVPGGIAVKFGSQDHESRH